MLARVCYVQLSYDAFRFMIEYLAAIETVPVARMEMDQHLKILSNIRQRRSDVERKGTAKTQRITQRKADNRHVSYTQLIQLCDDAGPLFMEFSHKKNRSREEVLLFFMYTCHKWWVLSKTIACLHIQYIAFVCTLRYTCLLLPKVPFTRTIIKPIRNFAA